MKAQFDAAGQTVEVDFTDMEKRLGDKVSAEMKRYIGEVKEQLQKEPNGKGVVEAFMGDEKKKIITEEFAKGERCDAAKIREQWTVTIPKAKFETAGHYRDYVWVTDVVKGNKGETVNIPYVYDIDFVHEATPHTGGSLTGKTSLISTLTTTLHESGAYYDAYYGDIEKIDGNMLDELNRVFAHAAVRAEDYDLQHLLNVLTTAQLSSRSGTTEYTDLYKVGTTCSAFTVDAVIDALGILMARGKEVHPGECVLIVSPLIWAELAKDIIDTTGIMYHSPDAAQGAIESILGIKIIITSSASPLEGKDNGGGTGSSYNAAWLVRPKRCMALAPKRDILIETDKLIKERQLRIAGSHTYGVCCIDPTEAVPILGDADAIPAGS